MKNQKQLIKWGAASLLLLLWVQAPVMGYEWLTSEEAPSSTSVSSSSKSNAFEPLALGGAIIKHSVLNQVKDFIY